MIVPYRFLLALVVLLFSCSAFGLTFTGRVTELPANLPSKGALCQIQLPDSTLCVARTDSLGSFALELDSIFSGAVPQISLQISKEGFETFRENLTVADSKNTEPKEYYLYKINTLADFTVEGHPITTNNGNLLYTPPKSITESSSYVIDMLGKLGIPGLMYNPVDRSVSSVSGNPVILIDGIPASQEDLKSLKPSRVLNVEYSAVVPAKYASMGTTLINVRLKKRENGGDWNIQDMNDFIGSGVDASTALRFHQEASVWKLASDFSYRNKDKTYDTASTEYLSDQLPLSSHSDKFSPFNYKTNNVSLQYTYAPSASLLLTARYNMNLYNSLRKSFSDIEDTLEGEYTADARTHNNSMRNNLNVYLSKSIGKSNSIDVNIDASIYSEDYESSQKYLYPTQTLTYTNILNSSRYALLGMANYGHSFRDNSQLNATYFLTLSSTKNKYLDTGNHFQLSESNHQFYLEYRKPFFKKVWLYLKSGAKVDHIVDNDRPSTYWNNISRLDINWNITPNWILNGNVGYQSKNLSLGLLQNNLVQTSPYLYNTGTPDLKPSSTVAAELSGNFYRANYSFYGGGIYTKSFSPILTTTLFDKDLNGYLSRPENGQYTESYYAYLGGNVWDIFKMFQVAGMIQFRHDKVMTKQGWKNHNNSLGGNFTIVWNYKKWGLWYAKGFPITVMDGFSLSAGEGYDMLALNFRPDQHWQLQLSYWYILSRRGWYNKSEFISPEYAYRNEREIHNDCNWIRFSVSYNISFGSPFKGKERSRSLNVTDTQSTYQDYVK